MRVDITTPATDAPMSFAISPDGRRLVFVAYDEGRARLWLRPLDATTAQPLAGTEGAIYPFWSPDSSALGFFADGKLKRIDISGGLPQTLAARPRRSRWDVECGRSDRVRADRGRVVEQRAVIRRRRRRGDTASIHRVRSVTDFLSSFQMADGSSSSSKVRRTRRVFTWARWTLRRTQRLTAADIAGAYLPPGWLLFMRQGTLVARRFNSTRGELTGDPITVADPVGLEASQFVERIFGLTRWHRGLSVQSEPAAGN